MHISRHALTIPSAPAKKVPDFHVYITAVQCGHIGKFLPGSVMVVIPEQGFSTFPVLQPFNTTCRDPNYKIIFVATT